MVKESVAPYIEPAYEALMNLGSGSGNLDSLSSRFEARRLATTQDRRYEQMLSGPQSRTFEAPGTVEQADGSSFEVGDNKRITSFTHAENADGSAHKISNIKYDDQGHLKSYTDPFGYSFHRTSALDDKGFGTWMASKNGRIYDYSGTGTKQFSANMMIDENGLSKLIGEPVSGQEHNHAGKMYWRNSDGSTVHSTPQFDQTGKLTGTESEVTLSDGEKFSRSSSLNEEGKFDSNLDLARIDQAEEKPETEEVAERKEKIEEIKDKIEGLEDPILELTNAFKKFEQIGGLEIQRDFDGSYKANIDYNGPRRMESAFNGPVTFKKGRPVWSKGMTLDSDISFNFRPTSDGVMIDRMSGVTSAASWKGIYASGPQNWMQLGKCRDGTPYMMANTTSTGSKRVLFWNFSRTENNTNTFTARNFKQGSGMRNFLSDSSAVDGLNGALKLFENAGISSLSMDRPDRSKPGDFDIGVRFQEDKEVKLDEKLEGPLELDSIKLASDLKFKIRQGADGADSDRNPDSVEIDASGITAKIQIGNNEGRLLEVQPKKVTISKDAEGKAVLQMHIESEQLKKLESANFAVALNDLDRVQSGKLTLVNVPLLKALSGTAMTELTKVAEKVD